MGGVGATPRSVAAEQLAPVEHAPLPVNCCELRYATNDLDCSDWPPNCTASGLSVL